MFKRKATLPARPLIPDNNAILEDLGKAKDDDIVFTIHPKASSCTTDLTTKDFFIPNYPNQEVTLDENEGLSNPDISYLKVKKFIEKVGYLECNIDVLEEQKVKLKKLKENLDEDMQRIKNELLNSSESSFAP